MRAVQITRFGGPEVLDVVDLLDPTPGEGEQLFELSSCGVNDADTPGSTFGELSLAISRTPGGRARHSPTGVLGEP